MLAISHFVEDFFPEFSKTAVGCTASYFVKIIWYSRWFRKHTPPPHLRKYIAIFVVAEGWLLLGIILCLFIVQSVNIYFSIIRNLIGRRYATIWMISSSYVRINYLRISLRTLISNNREQNEQKIHFNCTSYRIRIQCRLGDLFCFKVPLQKMKTKLFYQQLVFTLFKFYFFRLYDFPLRC